MRPSKAIAVIALFVLSISSHCTGTARDIFGNDDVESPDQTTDTSDETPADAGHDTTDMAPDLGDQEPDVAVDDANDANDAPLDAGDAELDTGWELIGSGTWADPYIVDRLPFAHSGDTRLSTERQVDAYACAPATDESGAEIVYRLVDIEAGIINASVDDSADDTSDVDVHLLLQHDPEACAVRDHIELFGVIADEDDPFVVVDTWVTSSGVELPGAYELQISREPLPSGACALVHDTIELFNREEPLRLPAIGEVVLEAHLVTTEEFPATWPTSSRDGIEDHYALSQSTTGYVMERDQPWAPEGEGGSEWGQGSTSRPPPLDEGWYVNMYWRNRPDRGARMLVYNPANNRAVVAAAGYETGPGSELRIGGACEEIHHHLGSEHRSKLLMAFLVDQTLPLGPIECQ